MNKRFFQLFSLLILLVYLNLSGCQYTRLFQFKNQLRYFDNHIEFDSQNSLTFKSPLLTGSDINALSGTKPFRITSHNHTEQWTFKLELNSTNLNQQIFHLILSFESGKLNHARYSPRLAQLIPKTLLRKSLISIGSRHTIRTK